MIRFVKIIISNVAGLLIGDMVYSFVKKKINNKLGGE